MEIRGLKNRYIFGGMALVIVLGGGMFFLRAPVLLVTDASFNALYGLRRAQVKRIEASLKLFRQVKPVLVADNAEPEMVAFAVEEKARDPYCVLFPYRYYEGAEGYAERFPRVPVIVLGGRNRDPGLEKAVFIGTDVETDFYRAGRCAAILALGQGPPEDQAPQGRGILFFQNREFSAAYKQRFLAGMREQGFEQEPIYVNSTSDYSDIKNIACVVMIERVSAFLERNLKTPVILFSWVDPNLTATGIKLIFDDSPWALAAGAVSGAVWKEGEGYIPSEMLFPARRLSNKEVLRNLKEVMRN
ncbi:MAG: hypothetical protein LBT14_14065 [Treponema sp.]|jgi:hypothetical protein|nr:hypothetical protein [Treponema sp.]